MPSAADSQEPGDAFDRIPKVELHCHVEGTVRAETVVELARKAGRPLPVDDPADLYRYDSLDLFLAVFWLVQETLVDRATGLASRTSRWSTAPPTACATARCSSRRPATWPPVRILGRSSTV